MPAKPRLNSPEDDLAFMRAIVEGGGRPPMTMAVCYLAGGLLYGLQCLFHVGQVAGLVRWSGLASLTWRDNSTNETGFEIERQRRSGSTWIETTTLTTPANTTATTNTAGLGTFRYRIRARNGTAASAWTAYVSITL